ncbi:hypothetical protein [Nioella sp.]|uniref:hypothetical protein n=1 Tax=Nioella sp. TaxID=1912091 RepID=UPI003B51BA75
MSDARWIDARFEGQITAARAKAYVVSDAFLEQPPEEPARSFLSTWTLEAKLRLIMRDCEGDWPTNEFLGPFSDRHAGCASDILIDVHFADLEPTVKEYKVSGKIPNSGILWASASPPRASLTLPMGSEHAIGAAFQQLPTSIMMTASHVDSISFLISELQIGYR